MDKRLDGAFWSEVDGKAGGVHSIDLQARNRRLFAEVAGTEGWPWLELRYTPPNARFIYCGFMLLEGWDQGPSPRYLLNNIFHSIANTLPISTKE
jgi:hypothetical protein